MRLTNPLTWLRLSVLAGAMLASSASAQNGATATPPSPAGTVELVEGDATIEAKTGGVRSAVANAPVYEGETITTFGNAELHLRMADNAHFSVRENSKITIATYIANGDEGDRSLIELTKGAFRAVTGWIGQFSLKARTAEGRNAYQVRTPLVTIGVRGTDHEPTHLLPGDPRGEPGSYDRVYDGKAFMQTSSGTLEIPPNRVAFHSHAGTARPQLLAALPKFFVPRRNEQRFVERAREGVRNLPQLRQARRKAVHFERSRTTPGVPGAVPHAPAPHTGAPQLPGEASRQGERPPQLPAPRSGFGAHEGLKAGKGLPAGAGPVEQMPQFSPTDRAADIRHPGEASGRGERQQQFPAPRSGFGSHEGMKAGKGLPGSEGKRPLEQTPPFSSADKGAAGARQLHPEFSAEPRARVPRKDHKGGEREGSRGPHKPGKGEPKS